MCDYDTLGWRRLFVGVVKSDHCHNTSRSCMRTYQKPARCTNPHLHVQGVDADADADADSGEYADAGADADADAERTFVGPTTGHSQSNVPKTRQPMLADGQELSMPSMPSTSSSGVGDGLSDVFKYKLPAGLSLLGPIEDDLLPSTTASHRAAAGGIGSVNFSGGPWQKESRAANQQREPGLGAWPPPPLPPVRAAAVHVPEITPLPLAQRTSGGFSNAEPLTPCGSRTLLPAALGAVAEHSPPPPGTSALLNYCVGSAASVACYAHPHPRPLPRPQTMTRNLDRLHKWHSSCALNCDAGALKYLERRVMNRGTSPLYPVSSAAGVAPLPQYNGSAVLWCFFA